MHILLSAKTTNLFVVVSTALLVGCSESVDTTSITGKVTYRAEPLANGSMMFYPERGAPLSAGIDTAGLYTAELPLGEYRVTIHAPGIQVPEGWKEGDPDPPPPAFTLPAKYSQRGKTTLGITVQETGESLTENFKLE